MVKKQKKGGKDLFECGACGFHYENEELAKKCETWCTAHNSCNLEIIKDSLESKKAFSR